MPLIIWHAIVHFMGVDYGFPYGHWIWYNFWSGIAGSFLIGMLVYLVVFYRNHTCHHSWKCVRWGKYEAAGGLFKLCHVHHPDLNGQRPNGDLIAKLHHEHKTRTSRA